MTGTARLKLLVLPAALFVLAVYVWPTLGLFRNAFNETGPTGAMIEAWSLKTSQEVFSDGFTFELTLNSLWLSLSATLIALMLSYPVALFLFRTNSRFRGLLAVIAIMPMLISGVVRVFGWLAILGDRGLVNTLAQSLGLISTPLKLVFNWTGVTIGLAESIMPYMILALLAGFGQLDRTLEEASRSLGASPVRTFWRVTLPLSLPALALAAGLGFVLSMSAYITPKLLGGGRVFVLATEIFEQATTNTNWPVASVLAIYTLVLLLLLLVASNIAARRTAAMNGAGRVLSSLAGIVYVLILAPIAIVVALAFSADNFILFPPSGYSLRWFNQLAHNAPLLNALWLSVQIACVVTLLSLALGVPAALALNKGSSAGAAH
jgi:putative spermidine/putrescine transport system permease protein